MKRALLLTCLAACRSGPEVGADDEVRVSDVALELSPEGRGRLSFALDSDGETQTDARVEWQLRLSGHDFAAGVSSPSPARPLRVDEPLAFGMTSWESRPRALRLKLEGTLVTKSRGIERRRGFIHESRVELRGAPLLELPRLQ